MKKVIYYLMLIPLSLTMLVGCSAAKTDAKSLEGKWTIVEVNGEKVSKEKMPFMEFDMAALRVHGNGSCNNFNSAIKLDPNNISNISFAPAAATMMACLDMAVESKIFKSLELINSITTGKDSNEIQLLDKEGNVLMVLSKQ